MILEMSPAIIQHVNSAQIADKSDYISNKLPEGVEEYMEEFRANFNPNFDLKKARAEYLEKIKDVHLNSMISHDLETGGIIVHEFNEAEGEYDEPYTIP